MLRTRFLAFSGMLLIFGSLILGSRFWGYPTTVTMLQAGIVALGLGLFFRLNTGENNDSDPLDHLYDLEGQIPA